jgi:Domain of unknown function (DUF4157)/DNA/RNA non-specific endonuclease
VTIGQTAGTAAWRAALDSAGKTGNNAGVVRTQQSARRTERAGKDEALGGQRDAARRSAARTPSHHLLGCQRAIGNRATSNLIQAALTVSRPSDQCEREADRVAAEVAARFDASALGLDPKPAQTTRRAFSTLVSRSAASAAGIDAAPDVAARIEAARGSGQPLPESVRAAMEPLFGADFRGVRVHADARADALNRALEARAFTTGHDIFFGHGQYQPTGRRGTELLAHELTHVVQQQDAPSSPASRVVMRAVTSVPGVGDEDDTYETQDFAYAGQTRQRPTRVVAYLGPNFGAKVTVHPISFISPADALDDIAGWHRGHIFGYSLRGPGRHDNIVPMYQRFNNSDWTILENELDNRRIAAGAMGNYAAEFRIGYVGAIDPRVPTEFDVRANARSADGSWHLDYGPWNLPHRADEPGLAPGRADQITDDLALVHGKKDDLCRTAAIEWRATLMRQYGFNSIDGATAAQLLHDQWHLPTLPPPHDRLYPAYAIYRPYEELDLLYLAGKLAIPVSRVQRPSQPFILEQRNLILEYNRARNGGNLMSDDQADDPHKQLRVFGTLDRPEIDHIIPTTSGGSNFFSNARVISFELNGKLKRVKNPAPFLLPGSVMAHRPVHNTLENDVLDVLVMLADKPRTPEVILEDVFLRCQTPLRSRVKTAMEVEAILKQHITDGTVTQTAAGLQLQDLATNRMDLF